jgi:hypothetical protein
VEATTMATSEEPAATYDMIAAYVFQRGGAEILRELFARPEFCWFRDEILAIGDALKAHGLDAAAKVMYEMLPRFPECPRGNPYDRTNPNWSYFEWERDRAEREGRLEALLEKYRHDHRENILRERGFGEDWRLQQWSEREAERKALRR